MIRLKEERHSLLELQWGQLHAYMTWPNGVFRAATVCFQALPNQVTYQGYGTKFYCQGHPILVNYRYTMSNSRFPDKPDFLGAVIRDTARGCTEEQGTQT